MVLGLDVASQVPFWRQEAESLMVDTGSISRPGEGGTLDPVTGLWTPTPAAVVHTGPCRLRQPNTAEQEVVFGDELVTRQRWLVDFPHTVTEGRIGDVITITASDDPEAEARSFRIVAESAMTYNLYREYACEAIEDGDA